MTSNLTDFDRFKIVSEYLIKALKITYAGHPAALEHPMVSCQLDDENIERSVHYYTEMLHSDSPVNNYLAECIRSTRKFVYEDTGVDVTRDEIWKNFDFVMIIENFIPIVLEKHQVSYESLTVGEFSFDYYIPEHKLVIEVTNIPEFTDNKADNQYFKRMNKSLYAKGIKLLRFGIDDLYFKADIVVSTILNHLNLNKDEISANECSVIELNTKQARKFTNTNHLNGHSNATTYLGLEYQGEIVQIISFAKHRYLHKTNNMEIWEAFKSCTKKFTKVQGGTQKIIEHFKESHPDVELRAYYDMNTLDDENYPLIGELIDETTGDLWYIIPDKYSPVGFKRVIRNRMMKIYLHKYFEGFPKRDDPSYKEINSVEFLRQQGIFAYYGSGNLVYKL